MIHFRILFVFFIIQSHLVMLAQDANAPLIERMQSSKGNGKIDLLNELSVQFRKTNRYTALDYARQAHTLSCANNYLPGKALAKKNEGICWFFIGNNDSALLCYKQALADYTTIGDKKGMSACYNNLGLISQETGKYDEALKYIQE